MLIEKDGSQVTEFDLQAHEQHLNKIRITPFEHGHVEKEEEPMEDMRYDDEEKHSKSYAHSRLAVRPFLSHNPRQRNTYIDNKPPIDLIEQRLQRIVEQEQMAPDIVKDRMIAQQKHKSLTSSINIWKVQPQQVNPKTLSDQKLNYLKQKSPEASTDNFHLTSGENAQEQRPMPRHQISGHNISQDLLASNASLRSNPRRSCDSHPSDSQIIDHLIVDSPALSKAQAA